MIDWSQQREREQAIERQRQERLLLLIIDGEMRSYHVRWIDLDNVVDDLRHLASHRPGVR